MGSPWRRCAALSSLAATFLIPRGLTGMEKANRYLERSSGSSRGIPRSAGPTNICTWPQKFLPRIAAGRAAATLRWMIATHGVYRGIYGEESEKPGTRDDRPDA